MAYPRYRAARAHKHFTYAVGNITLNSTAWADLPTIGTTWDAVLAAQAGDTIEGHLTAVVSNQAVASYFDIAVVVAGSVVSYLSNNTGVSHQGMPGMIGEASAFRYQFGGAVRTLVAGDIVAGTVTLRPRYRTSSATNRTLLGSADTPFSMWVKNLGPVDPN
jgi:hypothetical protein